MFYLFLVKNEEQSSNGSEDEEEDTSSSSSSSGSDSSSDDSSGGQEVSKTKLYRFWFSYKSKFSFLTLCFFSLYQSLFFSEKET